MRRLLTDISFNLSRSENGNRVKMERFTVIEINGPFALQVGCCFFCWFAHNVREPLLSSVGDSLRTGGRRRANVLFPAKAVLYKVVYTQQKALLHKDTAVNP